MKTLFFIVAVVCVTLSSCRTVKDKSSTLEVQHIKDSVNIIHSQIIDTIHVPTQKINGSIPVSVLKQLGEYSINKNGLTTRVVYVHDTLEIETTKDSTMIFTIRELFKEYSSKSNYQNKAIHQDKFTKIERSKNKFRAPFWVYLTLSLALFITIYLIIKKVIP